MRYFALATDYDGTIAHKGRVSESCLAALRRLRDSGRHLILVTGRELPELRQVCPELDLFDRVVAENGALLYTPETNEERPLAEPPPERFAQTLIARGVGPISVGRVIVATWTPHETTVVETIRDLGLEMQVIFNKGAVMVLPSGVNKATGLAVALRDLGLSPHNVVAVGDAENDHALFALSECSAAVSNALPTVKERADLTLERDHGDGVSDLIERILDDDLRSAESALSRHSITIGHYANQAELRISPFGRNILVAGPCGSGKARLVASLLERFAEKKYQYCVLDPEGDYADLADAFVLGDATQGPSVKSLCELLKSPSRSVVVNLIAMQGAERQKLFQELLAALIQLRAKVGRPHWLVIDEAQVTLARTNDSLKLPDSWHGTIAIADAPEFVAPEVIRRADELYVLGTEPPTTFHSLATLRDEPVPQFDPPRLANGDAYLWRPGQSATAQAFRPLPTRREWQSHVRRYLHGDVGREKSFVFAGPRGALQLRAQNLSIFLQLAEGVDGETWQHHLRQGDYSRWFREVLGDAILAAEAAQIESTADLGAQESRQQLRDAIERRYRLSD